MTHLTTKELAKRWKMHPGSLGNWRVQGYGPKFLKAGGKVLYPIKIVERWEKTQIR